MNTCQLGSIHVNKHRNFPFHVIHANTVYLHSFRFGMYLNLVWSNTCKFAKLALIRAKLALIRANSE